MDMADWRQIQARIRKAKNSPEALAKLSELYQRTRDAMVAWELGTVEEKAGRTGEAAKWYSIAAQRFRRADWKTKAEEALARLGVELPLPSAEVKEPTPISLPAEERAEPEAVIPEPAQESQHLGLGEIAEPEELVESSATEAPEQTGEAGQPGKRKRRRGRRGGRGRRRRGAGGGTGLPPQAFAEKSESQQRGQAAPPTIITERPASEPPAAIERPSRAEAPAPVLQLPSERTAHGRSDPGLASRIAHLDSLLRRLMGSALHRLDQADEAPAGPGVFLLSDSDQTTSYYVEACQTLRIGLSNLARGGQKSRGTGRGESSLKARFAEHLEINEAKVSQYMKDHCVVRWIQLDDEAPLLAHFAIAVLRTPLNLD